MASSDRLPVDVRIGAAVAKSLGLLWLQGKPSLLGSSCLYLSPDGARCAVGLLMGAVPGGLEGSGVDLDPDSDVGRAMCGSLIGVVHDLDSAADRLRLQQALGELQTLHDESGGGPPDIYRSSLVLRAARCVNLREIRSWGDAMKAARDKRALAMFCALAGDAILSAPATPWDAAQAMRAAVRVVPQAADALGDAVCSHFDFPLPSRPVRAQESA